MEILLLVVLVLLIFSLLGAVPGPVNANWLMVILLVLIILFVVGVVPQGWRLYR